MFEDGYDIGEWWVMRAAVGAVIGLGLGTMIAADPVSVPLAGTVPGIALGALVAGVGAALYTRLPDCDCGSGGSDCDCC